MVKMIVAFVVLLVLGSVGAWIGMSYVGYSNTDIELRNLAKAAQKDNENVYDKVWKVIQQKAGITDKYSKDFKEAYGGIMIARYGEGKNPMWSWVKEHNPELNVALYEDLSRSIEALRNEFQRVQTRLIDVKMQHDNLRQKIPSCWFIGKRPELIIQIVTSEKSKEAFSTGEENDIKLF